MKNIKNILIEYKTFLTASGLSDTTICKYIRNIEKLCEFSAIADPELFTESILCKYREFLTKKMEPASVNTYIIACNRFFCWYGRKDLHLSTIKIQRTNILEHLFCREEYDRLIKTSKAAGDMQLYLIMRVLGSSGIRISELRFVTVEMLPKNYTRIQNKGKNRVVFFPSQLCEELKNYCIKSGITAGIIFHARNSQKMITPSTVWRRLKKTAFAAGVSPEKIHAHNFRHFFAREFMNKYRNVCELADILGHSSLETTRIYTRTGYDEKQKMIDELNL